MGGGRGWGQLALCGGLSTGLEDMFVKYLFKYIHKQPDSAHMEVSSDGVLDADEIKQYIDCRYISPPEAAFRLLGKKMHGRSHSIFCLHVHQRHERIRGRRRRAFTKANERVQTLNPTNREYRLTQTESTSLRKATWTPFFG